MKTTNLAPSPQTVMTPSWQLVNPSVSLLQKHYLPIIYLFMLPSLLLLLGSLLIDDKHLAGLTQLSGHHVVGSFVLVAGIIWALANLAPSLYFRLAVTKGETVTVGECYRNGLPYFWRLLALDILVGLIVGVGMLLLIVPGLIFLRRYYLASYYLLDQKLGILEALKRSSHDTKPVHGYVWGIIGVQIIFSLVASFTEIVPVIGIIISILVSYVCLFLPALRYREVIKVAVSSD